MTQTMTMTSDDLIVSRQTAWHGLGSTVRDAMTSTDALKQAGLNWKVVQAPVQWENANGTLQSNDQYLCNYREDTGRLLGIVGRGYTVVQNETAFAFTDHLLGEGIHFEAGGVLNGGRAVWLCAKMPERQILHDVYAPHLLFINGHDGKTAVNVCMTPIRVVCQNALNMALNNALHRWGFVHKSNVMYRINEAQKTLRFASEYMRQLESTAERLAAVKLSSLELTESLKRLFPKPGHPAWDKRVQEKIDRLMQCYHEPDLDNFRGTAYGFLMAVSDYTTHVPFRSRDAAKARERHFMKTLMQPATLLATAYEMFAV